MKAIKPICSCPICKFCRTCKRGHCGVCHPDSSFHFPVRAHGLIASEHDVMKLNVINWRGLNGYWSNPGDALKTIASWLVNRAHYTIVDADIAKAPHRDDFPGWDHVGDHPRMGHLYWNWFHNYREGELIFSDSPDFYGTFRADGVENNFYGDIEYVSASAFAMQLKQMGFGDIWISVFHNKQIIIEPFVDNCKDWAAQLGIGSVVRDVNPPLAMVRRDANPLQLQLFS